MKVDCQWLEEHMEGFFVEQLSADEDLSARSHIESCPQCRQQVGDLRAIDPLIKKLFREDLAMSRAPRPRRSLIPAAAFSLATAAVVLVVVWRAPGPTAQPPVTPPQATLSPANTQPAPPVSKVSDAPTIDRAKPEPVASNQPDKSALKPSPPAADAAQPAFMVVDPAGYSRTLNDYRGYVLIFGVWGPDQPKSIAGLEHIYRALSSNSKLRIVGVTSTRETKPAEATFPTVRNQGSTLLGAKESEVLVVDGTGNVRFRGSLLESPNELLSSIRTTLTKLGVR